MLTCLICNKELKQLHQHLSKEHLMTTEIYRVKYNYTGPLQYVTDARKLEMSIKAKEGGSILNINYWINKKGYSIESAKAKISELQTKNSLKRVYKSNERIINTNYWVQRHGYTEEDAKNKVSAIQAGRSARSSKFKNKTHSLDSKIQISNTMSRHIKDSGSKEWLSHFGKFSGTSKQEINCYNEIKASVCTDIYSNVSISKYVVDMIYKNKVIEYYGDYWHANPTLYNNSYYNKTLKKTAAEIRQNDLERRNDLIILGNKVFIIWEKDWVVNKLLILEQVSKFLNGI